MVTRTFRLFTVFLLFTPLVWADPTVTNVQGTFAHRGDVTIQGSSFGTKTTAAPYIWDDCSGSDPNTKWDFVYPYTNDAAYRLTYRTPQQVTKANGVVGGVPLPHNRNTRYFAGAHYNSGPTDAHAGYNVCAGKNNQQGQQYTYISYYARQDPNWYFISGDHNYKEYDYAAGNGYMGNGPNTYHNLFNTDSATPTWGVNYIEGMTVTIRSVNTQTVTWYPQYDTVFAKNSVPEWRSTWRKVEYIIKHNDSVDGVDRIFQDNKLIWEVFLDDDGVTSTPARAETVFGGYVREVGTSEPYKNNWRYYADVYYDHSWARVMLANSANYTDATIVEPQLPSAWSATSITAKLNLGKLPDTGTVYLFVFDPANTRNAQGWPIVLNSTTPPNPAPGAPGNLRLQ